MTMQASTSISFRFSALSPADEERRPELCKTFESPLRDHRSARQLLQRFRCHLRRTASEARREGTPDRSGRDADTQTTLLPGILNHKHQQPHLVTIEYHDSIAVSGQGTSRRFSPRGCINLQGHQAVNHRPAVRRSWRRTTHADTASLGRVVRIEITEDSR